MHCTPVWWCFWPGPSGRRSNASTCRAPSIPRFTGHARLARRVARQIPYFGYDETRFFNSDGAPPDIATRWREGFMRLAQQFRERSAATLEMTDAVMDGVSDLQFISAYRMPFPYSRYIRARLLSPNQLKNLDFMINPGERLRWKI